jgi:hypothetical protein
MTTFPKDAEYIAFLEKRHELILKWLKNQAASVRKGKRKDLTVEAFWGSQMYDDEIRAAIAEAYRVNERIEGTASAYEYVIEAINNGTQRMLEDREPAFNDFVI